MLTPTEAADLLMRDIKAILNGKPPILTEERTAEGTFLKHGENVVVYFPYIPLQFMDRKDINV